MHTGTNKYWTFLSLHFFRRNSWQVLAEASREVPAWKTGSVHGSFPTCWHPSSGSASDSLPMGLKDTNNLRELPKTEPNTWRSDSICKGNLKQCSNKSRVFCQTQFRCSSRAETECRQTQWFGHDKKSIRWAYNRCYSVWSILGLLPWLAPPWDSLR